MFIVSQVKLPYDTNLVVDDPKNAWAQKWRGFQWNFSESTGANNVKSADDIDSYSSTRFNVIVGELSSTGDKIMVIEVKEVIDGERTVFFEVNLKLK